VNFFHNTVATAFKILVRSQRGCILRLSI